MNWDESAKTVKLVFFKEITLITNHCGGAVAQRVEQVG